MYGKYNNRRLREKKGDEKQVFITEEEIRDIFSIIPAKTVEYVASKRGRDSFDWDGNSISIASYADLIQSIKFLIEIIEYDLVDAFADKILRNVDPDDLNEDD